MYILLGKTKNDTYILKYMGETMDGSQYAWSIFNTNPLGILKFKDKKELLEYFKEIRDIVPQFDVLGNKIEKIYIRQIE